MLENQREGLVKGSDGRQGDMFRGVSVSFEALRRTPPSAIAVDPYSHGCSKTRIGACRGQLCLDSRSLRGFFLVSEERAGWSKFDHSQENAETHPGWLFSRPQMRHRARVSFERLRLTGPELASLAYHQPKPNPTPPTPTETPGDP